jgi:hypothetical protein
MALNGIISISSLVKFGQMAQNLKKDRRAEYIMVP